MNPAAFAFLKVLGSSPGNCKSALQPSTIPENPNVIFSSLRSHYRLSDLYLAGRAEPLKSIKVMPFYLS